MSSQAKDTAGARIRAGIDREGLTVEQFAVDFGVTSKTVYRWIHERHVPQRDHARRLAARFGGDWQDYLPELEEAA